MLPPFPWNRTQAATVQVVSQSQPATERMHQRRQAGRWLACRESWRHETTPGETWDFNSNLEIVLADLQIDGRPRQVILHAPKNGSVFVIDRATGKLISAGPVTETTWATRIDLENWFRERVAASSSVSTWR